MRSDAPKEEARDLVRPRAAINDRLGPTERNIFDPGEDPKGWDRASIKLNTHPLHLFPKLTPADRLLPYRPDRLRLAGDCLAVGVAIALLAYFPLLLVALAVTADISNWIWGTMAATGVVSAIYVFRRAWSPTLRDLERL